MSGSSVDIISILALMEKNVASIIKILKRQRKDDMNGHVFRSLVDSSFICAKLLLKKKKQLYSPICQKIRLRVKSKLHLSFCFTDHLRLFLNCQFRIFVYESKIF